MSAGTYWAGLEETEGGVAGSFPGQRLQQRAVAVAGGVDAALHVLILFTCMSPGPWSPDAASSSPGCSAGAVLGQLSYDKALLVHLVSQTDEFVVCLAGLKYGG